MNADSNSGRLDDEIALVMQVVEARTIVFLRDELGLIASGIEREMHHKKSLNLRAVTAIVGVGTREGLYIAYSYDESLIRVMTARYTEGLSISPEEQDLYARETASDVVNMIVGNSTAELAQRGELITLSPPVLMAGAQAIQGRAGSTIAALTLRFPEGALDVAFVGPKILFDAQLDHREEQS